MSEIELLTKCVESFHYEKRENMKEVVKKIGREAVREDVRENEGENEVKEVGREDVIIDEVHDKTIDDNDADEPPPMDNNFIDAVEDLGDLPTEGGAIATNEDVEPDREVGVTVQNAAIDNNDEDSSIAPDTIEPTNIAVSDNSNKSSIMDEHICR